MQKVNQRFFSDIITKPTPIIVKKFINSITADRRYYKVVCPIEPRLAKFLGLTGAMEVITFRDLPLHVRKFFQSEEEFTDKDLYLYEDTFAPDSYKAASDISSSLAGLSAFTILSDRAIPFQTKSVFYVFPRRGRAGQSVSIHHSERDAASAKSMTGRRLKALTKVPRQLDESFEGRSRERIQNALSTAAIGFASPVPETQLISFWSAFEVLMSDPKPNDTRITHFIRYLVPCISHKYHRRIFAAMHDYLTVSYRRRYQEIIRKVDENNFSDQHTKFAKLIVLPKYHDFRCDILSLASNDPLALHRLYRLEIYYGKPSSCRSTMIDHAQRVEWQLHRIYRTRNNLVHSGRSPDYMESLIRNAIDYFRSTIFAIARKGSERAGVRDLDQIISEVCIDHEMQLAKLKGLTEDLFDDQLVQQTFGYA